MACQLCGEAAIQTADILDDHIHLSCAHCGVIARMTTAQAKALAESLELRPDSYIEIIT